MTETLTDTEKLELRAVAEETERIAENRRLALARKAARTLGLSDEYADAEITLPDTDDLKELAKSAVPALVRRAIMMAASSDNLPQVLSVLKELTDRAHGKPEQAISQTVVVKREITDEELARRLLFNAALVNDDRMKRGLPVLEAEIVDTGNGE